MFRLILGFFSRRFLTDTQVQARYVDAGSCFGDALSYIYMGECDGFDGLLARFEKWETEYASRGYRTVKIDAFVEYGGYGIPIAGLGIKRPSEEAPVFYAREYRARFLGKVEPKLDVGKLMSEKNSGFQTGTYTIPGVDSDQ